MHVNSLSNFMTQPLKRIKLLKTTSTSYSCGKTSYSSYVMIASFSTFFLTSIFQYILYRIRSYRSCEFRSEVHISLVITHQRLKMCLKILLWLFVDLFTYKCWTLILLRSAQMKKKLIKWAYFVKSSNKVSNSEECSAQKLNSMKQQIKKENCNCESCLYYLSAT